MSKGNDPKILEICSGMTFYFHIIELLSKATFNPNFWSEPIDQDHKSEAAKKRPRPAATPPPFNKQNGRRRFPPPRELC